MKSQKQTKPWVDPFKESSERTSAFLNLLFGIDSGAMVYLLITQYNPGGITLPATLPFTIPPPHDELSFGLQVSVLAICTGMILVIHAIGLWKHQSQIYWLCVRRIAVVILLCTLVAIGMAGCKIMKNPELLKHGDQKQS